MAIVGSCVVVFGSVARFSLHVASRHSDSTPDSRRVPLSVHDYRAFYTVQTAPQKAPAVLVVSSRELNTCAIEGTFMQ